MQLCSGVLCKLVVFWCVLVKMLMNVVVLVVVCSCKLCMYKDLERKYFIVLHVAKIS